MSIQTPLERINPEILYIMTLNQPKRKNSRPVKQMANATHIAPGNANSSSILHPRYRPNPPPRDMTCLKYKLGSGVDFPDALDL
jgi:hypothetical protein